MKSSWWPGYWTQAFIVRHSLPALNAASKWAFKKIDNLEDVYMDGYVIVEEDVGL